MLFEISFLSAGAVIMLLMFFLTRKNRQKLMREGTKVQATVASIVQGRKDSAYALVFTLCGEEHRISYPKPPKGDPLGVGNQVTLYLNPEKPDSLFVEGDKAVLRAELLYLAIGVVLAVLVVLRLTQSL